MKEFGARMGKAESDDPDPHHYPYPRKVRHGWLRDTEGHWAYQSEDPHNWEVFCVQCGDADGPSEVQVGEARVLRGPFDSEHKAKRIADKHFKEN
jgi:hypothetical protein